MNKRITGAYYEQIAAQYLMENGYDILERNYRCRFGEIDLIARQGNYLVFIEVKFRTNREMGYPQEAVHRTKQRRIYQTAVQYITFHHLPYNTPCRFDVVSILGENITLIPNAFGGF